MAVMNGQTNRYISKRTLSSKKKWSVQDQID